MPIRSILYLVLCAAGGWAAPPMMHHDFEDNEAGWTAFGPDTAHVHVTRDASRVKNGKGALELDYVASASQPAAAVLPIPRSLGKMQSIRLWAMAESATAAAVTLSEKQGGRYVAIAWLEPQVWQRVELVPEDFKLATGPTDPKDPDGKLDLDKVEAIGVIDISQVLNQPIADHAQIAVVTHTGPRKLFIDDFEVSTDRPDWYRPRSAYQIDSFEHPQLGWFTLGGPELKLDTSQKVVHGNALVASYHQMEDAFVLIVHELPDADFSGATHLAFDIASDIDSHILFVLEQRAATPVRYHADVEVKGGGKAEHHEVALSAFVADTPDKTDGPINLSQLRTLTFLDITGAYTQQTAENTIHIGNIEMTKAAGRGK